MDIREALLNVYMSLWVGGYKRRSGQTESPTHNTYIYVYGLPWPEVRAPDADTAVFFRRDNRAVVRGADVHDGGAPALRHHGGWKRQSHLLAASQGVMLLCLHLHHV